MKQESQKHRYGVEKKQKKKTVKYLDHEILK